MCRSTLRRCRVANPGYRKGRPYGPCARAEAVRSKRVNREGRTYERCTGAEADTFNTGDLKGHPHER